MIGQSAHAVPTAKMMDRSIRRVTERHSSQKILLPATLLPAHVADRFGQVNGADSSGDTYEQEWK